MKRNICYWKSKDLFSISGKKIILTKSQKENGKKLHTMLRMAQFCENIGRGVFFQSVFLWNVFLQFAHFLSFASPTHPLSGWWIGNMTLLHATHPECMFYQFAALDLEEELFWLKIISSPASSSSPSPIVFLRNVCFASSKLCEFISSIAWFRGGAILADHHHHCLLGQPELELAETTTSWF